MHPLFSKHVQVPVHRVHIPGAEISLLRLDLVEPEISGNKWFKLKYNIAEVIERKLEGLITFGGAYSNHIAATSSAALKAGIRSVGIIRGEKEYAANHTLSYAVENGMELEFIPRSAYRNKNEPEFLKFWAEKYPGLLMVPEGGSNPAGVRGASEIMALVPDTAKRICVPVGTGGTLAGMITTVQDQEMIGFPVLKGVDYLNDEIKRLSGTGVKNWKLIHDYHEGGYAKLSDRLLTFIRWFYDRNGIRLDPVYNGKMMLGISEEVDAGRMRSRGLLAVHTGGLQGIKGMEERMGIEIF